MHILFITTLSAIITFLLVFLFKTALEKRSLKFGAYKIHHSVFGVLLFIIGIIFGNTTILSIGLGIYFGHVVEEMYFNKTNLVKAFFVFITKR